MAPGQRPGGLRRLDDPAGAGCVRRIRCSIRRRARQTYTGRYVTDVIADLGIDFIEKRPRNKPFFLMLHNKAPHRPWEPDETHRAAFAERWIPEPATLNDGYETRTDALHENEQRVADDLTRRDLKLSPPPGLSAADAARWLAVKPDTVTIVARRRDDRRSPARRSRAGSISATCRTISRPCNRWTTTSVACSPIWTAPASRAIRSSSTRATRASSSATTDCSTSDSCTRSRCACRSSCAGRR